MKLLKNKEGEAIAILLNDGAKLVAVYEADYENSCFKDMVKIELGQSRSFSRRTLFQIFKDENSTDFYWRALTDSAKFGRCLVWNDDERKGFFKEVDYKTALKKAKKFIKDY